MSSNKINSVFQFIDFLAANLENFKKHVPIATECFEDGKVIKKLKPDKSFADKKLFNDLEAKRKPLYNELQKNVLGPIELKALELDICARDNTGELVHNWGISQINEYKKTATEQHRQTALKHKKDYLKFRTVIQNFPNLLSPFFISDLDRNLKELFSYFDENTVKEFEEFEAFETKGIPVNRFEEALPTKNNSNKELNNNIEPNNMTISTIEDWLFEFKEQKVLTEPYYSNLVDALYHYFKNGTFPKLAVVIKVGKVNKKLFGWHLNRIFHSEGKGVDIDLLRFAKANISTFKDVDFDENNVRKSNLYKYFTTKTK